MFIHLFNYGIKYYYLFSDKTFNIVYGLDYNNDILASVKCSHYTNIYKTLLQCSLRQ